MFFFSRIHFIRNLIIFLTKRPYQQVYFEKNSLFQSLDVDQAIQSLKRDNLFLGINIPKGLLQEIQDFATSTTYFGNADFKYPFQLDKKQLFEQKYQTTFVDGHHLNPSRLCPAIKKIEQDPKLLKIAADYLETQPILLETRLRCTFVVEEDISESMHGIFKFHYDLENYRFIKFMFYLSYVDFGCGPHVCVMGSHKKKKLQHQFSLIREQDDQEIQDYYGQEKIKTIYGKAGFGFVEDLYCFHKATLPYSQDRLLLEIKFGMSAQGKLN